MEVKPGWRRVRNGRFGTEEIMETWIGNSGWSIYAMKLERFFVQELRDELQKPKKKKFMTPERKKKLRQVLTTIHQPLLHLQIHLHLHLHPHPGLHFHFI